MISGVRLIIFDENISTAVSVQKKKPRSHRCQSPTLSTRRPQEHPQLQWLPRVKRSVEPPVQVLLRPCRGNPLLRSLEIRGIRMHQRWSEARPEKIQDTYF